MIFVRQTRQRMSSAKTQAFSELHPCNLTARQIAVCNARNHIAHQPFSRIERKTSRNNALMQTLPFAVLLFPNPPVEVTAIIVKDGVSKDTIAFLIRSCEALQELVIGRRLIHHPRHEGSLVVGVLDIVSPGWAGES